MDSPSRSKRRVQVPPPPTGIRRRSGPPVPPLLLIFTLFVGLVVLLVIGFYLVTTRTVTLVIGGMQQDVRTYQPTVGSLLTDLRLLIEPEDSVSPARDTPIHNGLVITIDKAYPVILEVDGTRRRHLTHLIRPREILAEAKIDVGPHDAISVDGAAPVQDLKALTAAPPTYILVVRGLAIKIDDGGTLSSLYTVKSTVGEALADAGIPLYLADSVTPDPATVLTDGTTISIKRSIPIKVQVDGRLLDTRTHGKTVSEALADAGIALIGLDYAQPADTEPITSGMTIRVVRVTEEEAVERTDIDFKQIVKPDPTAELDTKKVIQPGVKGIRERRVRIRREDGREVSRSTPQVVIVQEPQDEIAVVGTLPILKTLNTPTGTIQYWRMLIMRAASYKPSSTGKSLDDPTYGITATGERLRKGIVAVDPKVIPLGSKLYIPGYGPAIAADTGGDVQGKVIDLGYNDDDYQEWSGPVEVYLLAPAPSPDQIPILPDDPNPTSQNPQEKS